MTSDRELAQSLIGPIGTPAYLIDVHGENDCRLFEINPLAEAFLGVTRSEALGASPYDLLSPGDAARADNRWRQCAREGARLEYKARILAPHGVRHVQVTLVPFHDKRARVSRIVGTAVDVTPAVRVSSATPEVDGTVESASCLCRALAGSIGPGTVGCEQLMEAVGHLGVGALLLNAEGEVVYGNDVAEDFLRQAEHASHIERYAVCLATDASGLLPDSPLHLSLGPYRVRGQRLDVGGGTHGAAIWLVPRRSEVRLPSLPSLMEQHGFTRREAEVAIHLAHGRSAREIGKRCAISLHTARRHVERVLPKLGVHSRAEVAAAILRLSCPDVPVGGENPIRAGRGTTGGAKAVRRGVEGLA